MFYRKNKKRGFTLIELMVVFVIMGYLSMIFFSILNRAKEKSVNVSVVQSAVQFRKAAELYAFNNGGVYPGEGGTGAFYVGKHLESGSYVDYGPNNLYGIPNGDMSSFEDAIDEYMPINILESPIEGQYIVYFRGSNYGCGNATPLRYMILIGNVGGFESEDLPFWTINGTTNNVYYCVPGPEN